MHTLMTASRAQESDNQDLAKTIQKHEKTIYDLNQLLQVSRALTSSLDYEYILDIILDITLTHAYTQNVALLLTPDLESKAFTLYNNTRGIDFEKSHKINLILSPEMTRFILDRDVGISFAELKENTESENNATIRYLKKYKITLLIPLLAKHRILGFALLTEKMDKSSYSLDERKYLQDLLMLAGIAIENAYLFKQATTDFKTNLKNYSYWHYFSREIFMHAKEQKQPVCLLMIDIDDFKQFNDIYGHQLGDVVLSKVGEIIISILAPLSGSLSARYGGEEFCILLPNVKEEKGFEIAEEIRKQTEEIVLIHKKKELHITISIGIRSVLLPSAQDTVKQLLEQADQALYYSKKNGKNQSNVYKKK